MSLAPDSSHLAASNLQTVSIVCTSNNPMTQLWIDALKENGAEMLEDTEIQTLQDITRQKLAVIFDQEIDEVEKEKIIQKYELLFMKNDIRSLRFFEFIWNKNTSHNHDRLRTINLMKTAPSTLSTCINHELYKSRLPIFLRKNYHVEISDTLEEISGIQYRPITIRSYKMSGRKNSVGEIDYESKGLYIHDKKLFSGGIDEKPQTLHQIDENSNVYIQKFESRIPKTLAHLEILKKTTKEK